MPKFPPNLLQKALNQMWTVLMAIVVLVTTGFAVVKYDNTLAKECDVTQSVNTVRSELEGELRSLRAMLLLKISDDLVVTLTKRVWNIKDSYDDSNYPPAIQVELHKLEDELRQAEEERTYWSSEVRAHGTKLMRSKS